MQRHVAFAIAVAALIARQASAQCPDGTPPPCGSGAAPRSVAVLTFDNITRDTTAQYLAESLADQIFSRLAQVERLTVISRSAVRRLRSADQLSVQQLGRALNAAYLVNGSLRMAGGRLHVIVEALRAGTGAAIWSTAFDREQGDLLGLEEAIATEVAAGIAGRLTSREQHVLALRVTRNPSAYARYLRGNFLLARRTPESIARAIADYSAAVQADPGLVVAHARLALAYGLCVQWKTCGRDTALALGRREADDALALDARSAEAWMGRAVLLFQQHAAGGMAPDTLSAVFAALRRSVELDPRDAEAWHHYGALLTGINDSLAEASLRRAIGLDASRAISYGDLATLYATRRRSAQAVRRADSAIALDSNTFYFELRAMARLEAGDTAGALDDARAHPASIVSASLLSGFAADTTARRTLASSLSFYDIQEARYLLWVGQRDTAVDAAIRLLAENPWRAGHEYRRPLYDSIREDPRFRAAMEAAWRELARVRWR